MRTDRRDLQRLLTKLAASQSGFFSAAQAKDIGYSYQAQKYHSDRGNWVKVERGIYRLPEWPIGRHDHLVQWTLWSRGRAVVSHETALAIHDLGDVNPSRVHLTVPPNFRAEAPGAILHRGEIPPGEVEEREGFRVTTPLRTVLDVAASDLELDQFARAVRELCDRRPTTKEGLLHRAEEFGPAAALRIERALRIEGLL